MHTSVLVLYGFSFLLASILLQQVLPFPFGLYSGLLVFAVVPIILRKYIKDLGKNRAANDATPIKS